MKILAIADRRPKKSLKEVIDSEGIELVVTLGDLDYFDIKELQMVDHIPKIGVYGNHCSGNYMDNLGIIDLHLRTMEIGGMTFGGFQGCVRYKNNPDAIMCTQEEAIAWAQQLPPVDVMLSHAPPFGINDDQTEASHTGFTALRTYLDTHQPKHWFHGHTYPFTQSTTTQHNNTLIHYIFEVGIITV